VKVVGPYIAVAAVVGLIVWSWAPGWAAVGVVALVYLAMSAWWHSI